jgi:uncharacterized protein (DUF488 family)
MESQGEGKGTLHIYTIGHSNNSMREFVAMLRSFDVEVLIDVRRWPRSRSFEHFNRETIEEVMEKEGIRYLWLGERLGGFRKGGYEHYMKGDTFKEGVQELLNEAKKGQTAIMCSESLWFKCHRRLIAEYLVVLGHEVSHIVDTKKIYSHRMRSAEFIHIDEKKKRLRL